MKKIDSIMISVVIPLYNKEKQIAHTLQSVLNQTFQDFEIVVVDDGSTDESITEVEKFSDSRIRLIHQQNAGVSAARNRGIEEAKGELIAFLDADDEWKSEYLASQYYLYQKYPDCSVYACNYEFCDSEGKVISTIIRKIPFAGEDGILSNYFEVACCSHPPLWTSAVMVKKQAIRDICGFPIGIPSGEDLLTWARLAIQYNIAYSCHSMAIYNTRNEQERSLSDLRKTAPPDLKSVKDQVGLALQHLYIEHRDDNQKKQLAMYIAFRYKMRAVVNLNLNYRFAAIKCSCKSLAFNKKKLNVYFLILLSLFVPYSLVKRILK